MKTSEVLRKALERLGPNGENWCQGRLAQTEAGQGTAHFDVACRFCGFGALMVAEGVSYVGDPTPQAQIALSYLNKVVQPVQYIDWQDAGTRTFPEVRDAFLRAIALAEAEEANA